MATLATLHNVHPRVLQRLVLYKTSAYTSSKAHPIWALSERQIAEMFIVFCFPDTNVAGFDNYVVLKKLDLRTAGVDGYNVLATG